MSCVHPSVVVEKRTRRRHWGSVPRKKKRIDPFVQHQALVVHQDRLYFVLSSVATLCFSIKR